MSLSDIGSKLYQIKFDGNYPNKLFAVQGETDRTFAFKITDENNMPINGTGLVLEMAIYVRNSRAGVTKTTGDSNGIFVIQLEQGLLYDYDENASYQMFLRDTERKILASRSGRIEIERNLQFNGNVKENLLFDFAEITKIVANLDDIKAGVNQTLNETVITRDESCECATVSKIAMEESKRIETELSDVFETEQSRVTAEEDRRKSEAQRIADEKIRLEKEGTRQSEEATRKSAEENRIADEKTRQSEENTRKSQETARESAEEKRVSAETIRDEQEEVRKSNEIKREDNEGTRIAQEEARVTAEEERKTKFDGWDKTMKGVIPNATETDTGVVKISALDTEEAPYTVPTIGRFDTEIAVLKSDVAKKQDKLTAGDNIDITRDTISATDTITTINGKTGAISKADITALGIPSQDTVYKKPASEPISYIQGLQAELDSKVESYGANPVLNIAVISAGGSTTSIPNNTLILELE